MSGAPWMTETLLTCPDAWLRFSPFVGGGCGRCGIGVRGQRNAFAL
jgi:hypothetical protein